jgi:hypothetical protein
MKLDLTTDWPKIAAYVDQAIKANFFVAFATVGAAGEPAATPIGSLVLNDDPSGVFMERFPRSLPAHADDNPNFCLLAENPRLPALLKQFRGDHWYGLKLYGQFGAKRPATADDIDRFRRRLHLRWFRRAEHLLISGTVYARDVTFTRAEAIAITYDKAAGRLHIP